MSCRTRSPSDWPVHADAAPEKTKSLLQGVNRRRSTLVRTSASTSWLSSSGPGRSWWMVAEGAHLRAQLPASASPKALVAFCHRREIRRWALHHRSYKSLEELARQYNPTIRGWIAYYSHFYKTQLRPTLKRIDAMSFEGPVASTKRMVHQTKGGRDWFGPAAPEDAEALCQLVPMSCNGRTSGAV